VRHREGEDEALGEEMENGGKEEKKREGEEREERGRVGRPSKVELLRREREDGAREEKGAYKSS